MKKIIYCFMFMMLLSVCLNGRQADAYSVSVEKDSIYAENIPSYIMKNVAPMFKKQVRKSMKYYEKYKDAGDYTYIKKIPDTYRDFIEVAKEIQDSDKIVIRYPFYIYDAVEGECWYKYYFVAEKNHKKLCIFSIDVNSDNGKTIFYYDKMLDHYFLLDENITKETLFYQIEDMVYGETPEQVKIIRNMTIAGEKKMEGESTDKGVKAFSQKNYEEKKNIIFSYLDDIKNGKVAEQSNENIKMELKKEYSEPDTEADEKKDQRGLYIAIGAGGFCILLVGIIIGIVIKKRKK